MKKEKKWIICEQDEDEVSTLCKTLGVSPVTARVLCNRGYRDPQSAKIFIDKSESFLHDPFLMKDMDVAVARIMRATEGNEKITVYGDYDADGVTSVSMLLRYFRDRGISADFYIPSREYEGYGMSRDAIDTIAASGTKLIITVDTGITAVSEVEYAKSLGVDTVITDHHQCPEILPDAVAVINPHRADCGYPYKDLAGVGVAFKLICALELARENDGKYNLDTIKDMCRSYISLAAIGTIADVMPVTGENRIIIHIGLGLLRGTEDVSMKSLLCAAGIETDSGRNRKSVLKRISVSSIAFGVAPRINAAGRMGDAGRAVQLFMTESPMLADAIAEELCAFNRERQALENSILKEAEAFLFKNPHAAECDVLVISGDSWHHGVIGIVASKITERYGKPCVLISFAKDSDEGRGSARSVIGFDIFAAFSACSKLLTKFGGHELAAGLTIERGNVDAFREAINAYASDAFAAGMPEPVCEIDCEVSESDINMVEANELMRLEPYGAGNPAPVFLLKNAQIDDITLLKEDKHTKLMIKSGDMLVPALLFGRNLISEGYECGDSADIVFSLDINEFRGMSSIQMMAKEIRFGKDTLLEYIEAEEYAEKVILGREVCEAEDYPDRCDFVLFYKFLQKNAPAKGTEINIKAALRALPSVSFVKLKIMMAVFIDAGLITADKCSGMTYSFSLPKVTEKTDIINNRLLNGIKTE